MLLLLQLGYGTPGLSSMLTPPSTDVVFPLPVHHVDVTTIAVGAVIGALLVLYVTLAVIFRKRWIPYVRRCCQKCGCARGDVRVVMPSDSAQVRHNVVAAAS
jgi:hypothetical protein